MHRLKQSRSTPQWVAESGPLFLSNTFKPAIGSQGLIAFIALWKKTSGPITGLFLHGLYALSLVILLVIPSRQLISGLPTGATK